MSSQKSAVPGTWEPPKTGTHSFKPWFKIGDDWGLVAWHILEIFVAETVGTAMLLFFGCMGIIPWTLGEKLSPVQGALVFAVAVATIIQIFGHISAAHLNPAVTIAFMVLGHVTPAMAVIYVFAECVGAILGYGLLMLLTPADILSRSPGGLCVTVPQADVSDFQAVVMEFVATSTIILVVCSCVDPRRAGSSDSAPIKFFCTILAISIGVGPYTCASMNPARSMAPALFNNAWSGQWIYWVATCPAGYLTAVFYQAIFLRKHVSSPALEEVTLKEVTANISRIEKH